MELKTILITFFISTALVSFVYPSLTQEDKPLVSPGRMDAVEAISPASQDYNLYMLENLSPKYQTYLENCMDKMGDAYNKCNEDVVEEILNKKFVSRECCQKLVKAGKQCYLETRKVLLRFYQLKHFDSQVLFITNEIWDRCSAEVENPSSSRY